MCEMIYKLILCHLVGDYVLQIDFIAKTKGSNWWHLLTHCFLYSLPFYIAFGFVLQLPVIIGSHIIVDALKARWQKINYIEDQVIHILTMMIYLI